MKIAWARWIGDSTQSQLIRIGVFASLDRADISNSRAINDEANITEKIGNKAPSESSAPKPPISEPNANISVAFSDEAAPTFFEYKLMKWPPAAGEMAPLQAINTAMPMITCQNGGSVNIHKSTINAAVISCTEFAQ